MKTALPSVLLAATAAAALPGGAAEPRKEVRIAAADLAPPAVRADEPAPGKWWLRRDARDWGAPEGVLMTGRPAEGKIKTGEWVVLPAGRFVPYRVPALTVDPKVKGWHRVHVGLYHDPAYPDAGPRLLARLSGEPFSEYLQASARLKGRTAEVYWRAADLTGKKLVFEQPPAPMNHPGRGLVAGITHVRLVPMSAAEVADARKEVELPPAERRLFGMLDYTDEVFWWGTLESEDDVRAIVHRHAQAGFGRIYWRAYGSHLDNSLAVPAAAPVWTEADEKRWCKAQKCPVGWKAYIDLTRKFDPLKVAVEHGPKAGCEVHAWVRFTNHNREPYSRFWHDHPEYRAQMVAAKTDPKTGKRVPIRPYVRSAYPRVLSMAYPEVRAYYVSFCKQLASTGTKGILLDLLRHPPIAGYEKVVADAFKKKYGMDMEERDVYHDPLVNEHLSEYLRLFLIDLRKAVGPDVEIAIRSSGPDKYALRGKAWIAEGLVDTIIDGNWYSGNGPMPTIDATVAAAGARDVKAKLSHLPGRAFAIAEPSDVNPLKGWGRRPGLLSPGALRALARHYSGKGVARFGVYESTYFTWYPELRRAVRAAGWDYEPAKKGPAKGF
jgi:hypothetical protein